MKSYKNGHRYEYTEYYDKPLNQPYDYERNGLLKHMVSQRIVNTTNPITKFIYNVFEKELVFVLKYADILANFRNPFFRNR
jgi:hypothetical protein